MKRLHTCSAVLLLALLAGARAACAFQAPPSAQAWEVAFAADQSGPLAEGPNVTQVGITMSARVTILPGTHNTANFGISRVGGAAFRMTFTDPFAAALGLSQGSLSRGQTVAVDTRNLTDTTGQPLAGMFAPLRGSFQPQVAPMYLGSNGDTGNGLFTNPSTGGPFVTSVIGARTFNFGSEGTGPYGRDALAPVYRVVYTPRPGPPRMIHVDVSGIGARYVYAVSGSTGQVAPAVTLPGQAFFFQVGVPCPEVTSQPSEQVVCAGTSATFSIAVAGHAPTMTYQWRRNGEPLVNTPVGGSSDGMIIAGATSASMTLSGVTEERGGTLDCVVTNACGSVTSLAATLQVRPVGCCRRDVNGDGVIDADDLGDLLNEYFAMPPGASADFNRDGAVDADDLGDFFNAYFGSAC